jgi:hypothetical protein
LNATLWLRGNIVNGSENVPQVSYGMFIDGDSKRETGWQGVDYQTEISWQNGGYKELSAVRFCVWSTMLTCYKVS